MNRILANALPAQLLQFDVSLINYPWVTLMKLIYALCGILLAVLGIVLLQKMHQPSELLALFCMMLGPVLAFALYHLLAEKNTTDLSGILLSADKLRVLKYRADKELTVFLTEIESYKFTVSQGVISLQLWLHDGQYAALNTKVSYKGVENFIAMCQSLEGFANNSRSLTAMTYSNNLSQGISRRKRFFEKPLSTYVFVMLIPTTAALIYWCVTQGRPVDRLWPLFLAPLSYGIPWYLSRGERTT